MQPLALPLITHWTDYNAYSKFSSARVFAPEESSREAFLSF
jgi:hypothetical protein